MKPFLLARSSLLAFVLPWLAVIAGCAGEDTEASGGPPAETTTAQGGTGGGGAGGGGEGGAGGDPGLCGADCSKIDTPPCLQAVCNEGQYVGTVGECVVVNAADGAGCDLGLFCTHDDTCQAGQCVEGPQFKCGMTPPECMVITCDEASQMCTTVPGDEGDSCTPDDLCTIGATCKAGVCSGAPLDCAFSPFTECNTVVCNPATGECDPTPDPVKDGDDCALTGDPCMVKKACAAGACDGGAPKDCSGLTAGCVNGVCNMQSGACEAEPIAAGGMCLDGTDACNLGICDNNGNCVPTPVIDGTACNDFNSCTSSDTCSAGSCNGSVVLGCLAYFSENFDACPNGWTFGGDWECGKPTVVGPASAHSGLGCIGTVIDGNYSASQSYAMANADSPPIDLGTATAPKLLAWAWVDTEGKTLDGYNVKVSTDGGANFAVVSSVEPPYPLTVNAQPAWGGHLAAEGWQPIEVDLAAFAGQEVIVRFSFRSDGSLQYPGVYIDDIVVAEPAAVPLKITTTSPLPTAYVGYLYSVAMKRVGGSPAAVWSIVGGANHGWLSINPSTGQLTGTPAVANIGSGNVVVRIAEPTLPSNADQVTFDFDVQSVLLLQNFDGGCPNGWLLTGDWQCGMPTSGPNAAFSGGQCIATQLASNYSNGQGYATTTASSPDVDLTGAASPSLAFRVWIDTEGNTYDGFNLKVSTNGGASYATVTTVIPAYPLTIDGQPAWGGHLAADGWQLFQADLSAFAGQTIRIQFSFRSDGSIQYPGVYIDDVVVSD